MNAKSCEWHEDTGRNTSGSHIIWTSPLALINDVVVTYKNLSHISCDILLPLYFPFLSCSCSLSCFSWNEQAQPKKAEGGHLCYPLLGGNNQGVIMQTVQVAWGVLTCPVAVGGKGGEVTPSRGCMLMTSDGVRSASGGCKGRYTQSSDCCILLYVYLANLSTVSREAMMPQVRLQAVWKFNTVSGCTLKDRLLHLLAEVESSTALGLVFCKTTSDWHSGKCAFP